MPAPAAPAQPATLDELATLYLRARDVPCPGCGYNRRDGQSVACPECGHHLRLQPVARNPLELSPAACYWLAGTLIVLAVMLVPSQAGQVIRMSVNNPGQSWAQQWVFELAAVNLGFLVGACFAVLTILRVRRRHPRAAHAATLAVAALLAGFSVPAVLMLSDLF